MQSLIDDFVQSNQSLYKFRHDLEDIFYSILPEGFQIIFWWDEITGYYANVVNIQTNPSQRYQYEFNPYPNEDQTMFADTSSIMIHGTQETHDKILKILNDFYISSLNSKKRASVV